MTAEPAVQEHSQVQHVHPGASVYVPVAIVLAVLTGLEIAVYYSPIPTAVMVALVLILAIANVALSVMFYMHLRYDARVLTGMFSGALGLAILLAISLLLIFGYLLHHLWIAQPFTRLIIH